jgi:PAS domain S-box-containing protein
MKLQGISIRTRATVAAMLALAITAIAFGVALTATLDSRSHSETLAHRLIPAGAAVDDLLTSIAGQRTLLHDAVADGRASGLELADAAGAAARADAVRVGRYANGDAEMTSRLGDLTGSYREWVAHVYDPQAAALRRGDAAAAQALQADNAHTAPYVLAVRATGLALETQLSGEQQAVTSSLSTASDVILGAIIAMFVVTAALAADVLSGVWGGLLKPFRQLRRSVAASADADYQEPIPAVGPPELAELSRNVELMRTRLAAALAERERTMESLQDMLDVAPDAIIGVARDGSIMMANERAVQTFGCPAGDLVGRPVATLVPAEQRADLAAETGRYFADERHRAHWHATAAAALRFDGSTFPAEVRMSKLPTDDGQVIIVSIRDVSERAAVEAERERLRDAAEQDRLQRRLRQSQRLESLGQLVGGVAHDFNNLLGVISGYADFTVEQLRPMAQEDERLAPVLGDVEQVQAAAQQAIRVTRQLLTFAKGEQGKPEVLDLNEVVEGAGQLLRRSLGDQIELVVAAGAGLRPVEADRGQLDQVVVNLAVNARDAMPDGGRLTIATANTEVDAGYAEQRPGMKPGRYCQLTVADTGTGMDQATIDRVFEPFFSTKPRGRGTGLGLATVYGIVSGLGGTIDIYSEPGFGTTMNVLLPAAAQPAAAQPAAAQPAAAQPVVTVPRPSPPAEPARGHGEAILLVEDQESLRTMASRILGGNGYLVREVGSGTEAVRLVGDPDERIDLLVTDMVMPGMLGTEVVAQARAVRPGLPVLFMTGYAQQVLDFHGIDTRDVDIVQKPFTEAVLLTRVRQALGKARSPAGA